MLVFGWSFQSELILRFECCSIRVVVSVRIEFSVRTALSTAVLSTVHLKLTKNRDVTRVGAFRLDI